MLLRVSDIPVLALYYLFYFIVFKIIIIWGNISDRSSKKQCIRTFVVIIQLSFCFFGAVFFCKCWHIDLYKHVLCMNQCIYPSVTYSEKSAWRMHCVLPKSSSLCCNMCSLYLYIFFTPITSVNGGPTNPFISIKKLKVNPIPLRLCVFSTLCVTFFFCIYFIFHLFCFLIISISLSFCHFLGVVSRSRVAWVSPFRSSSFFFISQYTSSKPFNCYIYLYIKIYVYICHSEIYSVIKLRRKSKREQRIFSTSDLRISAIITNAYPISLIMHKYSD